MWNDGGGRSRADTYIPRARWTSPIAFAFDAQPLRTCTAGEPAQRNIYQKTWQCEQRPYKAKAPAPLPWPLPKDKQLLHTMDEIWAKVRDQRICTGCSCGGMLQIHVPRLKRPLKTVNAHASIIEAWGRAHHGWVRAQCAGVLMSSIQALRSGDCGEGSSRIVSTTGGWHWSWARGLVLIVDSSAWWRKQTTTSTPPPHAPPRAGRACP